MSSQNKKYYLGLAKIPCIGPAKFNKLKKSLHCLEEAWKAPITKLEELGFGEKCVAEFIRIRTEINLDQEMEKHEKEGIQIITCEDEEYPSILKEIYDPPFVIFCRGKIPKNSDFLVAAVGSRKFTSYGKQATEKICGELAKQGITIVSGLAIGIDSIAHFSALESRGKTMAVLGCGIEKQNIYPNINRMLSEKIIQSSGCLISEHPAGVPPYKSNFPRRNRIISGISLGTIIIEAAEKSGALITARSALEQNREVFAVPGPITSPYSFGTNNLIKMGARPVTCAQDVLDCLNLRQAIEYSVAREITPDSAEEAILLKYIEREPAHIDDIIRASKMKPQEVSSALTLMEMKGKVKHLGGMKYALAR